MIHYGIDPNVSTVCIVHLDFLNLTRFKTTNKAESLMLCLKVNFIGFPIFINGTKRFLGKFPTLSRSQTLSDIGIGQSQSVHPSQSFSRLDSSRSTPAIRSRASTLQNTRDIFEKSNSATEMALSRTNHAISSPSQEFQHGFDELPIELMSLIDRYGVNLFCMGNAKFEI